VLNRRQLAFVVLGACLLLASGASAAEGDAFTATSSPVHVKPSAPASYTITLTNSAASPSRAQRATIAIPPGFTAEGTSIQATTQALGGCNGSAWEVHGAVTSEINLRRPGNNDTGLCPGAALAISFTATSAADEAAYTWTSHLLVGDTEEFALNGSQPVVVVDGTAPQTEIGSGPPSLTRNTSASFTFSSEPDATFECSLDSGAFTPCTSPKDYTGLGGGNHTFAVQATDRAGNTDATPGTTSWIIDLTAPETTVNAGPPPVTKETSASFTFSSEPGATFECSLDSVEEGTFTACTSPTLYTNVPEGFRTFRVRGTDQVGNVEPTPASSTWTVDTTQPVVGISGDKPGNPTNVPTASFTFTSNEPSTFHCRLDTPTFDPVPCTSPMGYAVADGQHTFVVRATDAAGNTAEASHTWEVDRAAPTVNIGSRPASATKSRTATFTFAADSDAATTCKLDGGAFEACVLSKTYSGLPDGSHTFTVAATDPARNTAEDVYTWTIDNVPPTVTIVQAPNSVSDLKSPTFAFSVNDGAVTCKLDSGSTSPCLSPKTYTNLPDGDHVFTVSSTDAAGNTGQDAHTWRIETKLAVATLSDKPRNPSTSTSARFHFASRAGATFECSLDGAAFTACTSPKDYAGLAQGAHTFAVRAKDGAGTGPALSYAWSVDSVGPAAVISQGPGNPTNSQSATFAFSANESASFVCQLDGGGFGPCASPWSYQGLGDGAHTFSVRPSDGLGNVGTAASYSWHVDATAPETTLGSRPASRTTATAATFTFSANEGAAFECKLDAGSFAPCSSPKTHTGLTRTAHAFEVRAVDVAGNLDSTPAIHRWTVTRPVVRTRKAASALLAPAAGARVTRPPLLRWRRTPRASYYNVQLYRGSVKVLSAWPATTRLQLKARWRYLGRPRRLTAGTYRWYVWPGFGKPTQRRYGRSLGGRTFRVVSRGGR
jgi:large repetitive protein